MNQPPQTHSEAMLLRGVDNLPGRLKLSDGRLTFIASERGTFSNGQLQKLEQDSGQTGLAEALLQGISALVFDVPLAEVGVKFPWYYFLGGCKLTVKGVEYRLSFGGAVQTGESLGSPDEWDFAFSVKDGTGQMKDNIKEIAKMRHVGKTWKQALLP